MMRSFFFFFLITLISCIYNNIAADTNDTEDEKTTEKPTTTAITETTTEPPKKPDSPKCSFDNLRKVIGNNEFSILGKLANCQVFYVVGDEVEGNAFNVSEITGTLKGCKDMMPFFYKNSTGYKVLMAQRKSMYLFDCNWQNSTVGYHSCEFDRNKAERKIAKFPEEGDDTPIGHVTDVNTDVVHIIYKNEESDIFDGAYSLSKSAFLSQKQMEDKDFEHFAYDSDLKRFYYENVKLGYRDVESNNGLFTFGENHTQLESFRETGFTEFSFSNGFYIIKKKVGADRIAFYAGHEGNPKLQECITETQTSQGLSMHLFVGKGDKSAHAMIRATISPKVVTTTTPTTPPPTSSTASLLFSSLLLLLAALALLQ